MLISFFVKMPSYFEKCPCADELISALKIMTFSPKDASVNETSKGELNPML